MADTGDVRDEGSWRAPTALVLGVLAGVLAALTVLPTVVPLTQRVAAAEHEALLAQTIAAGRAVAVLEERQPVLQAGLARRLGVDGLKVIDVTGNTVYTDGTSPTASIAAVCPPGEQAGRLVTLAEERWAVACEHVGTSLVISSRRPGEDPTKRLGTLVAALACMAGMSTAFGVLQVLSPLSGIKAWLEKVVSGERGVQVPSTGLAELDELVDRVNSAARAIEDREDAIQGRLQVVQEMARVVAHEIRNPLQAMEVQVSLIADEADPEERKYYAKAIREEVRSLEGVVSRMMRGGAHSPVKVTGSIGAMLHNLVSFHRPNAKTRGVRLEEGAMSSVELPFDKTLMTRAVENLIVNALAFVPQGHGRIVVSCFDTPDEVVVSVDDNGPGVSPTIEHELGISPVTLRPGGQGLGLIMVKGVIAAHEGSFEYARSELGGARFRIRLPRHTPPLG